MAEAEAPRSPARDAVDRELLELVKDVRRTMDPSQSASGTQQPGREAGNRQDPPSDEVAALVASRGSPLAGLGFKQSLPVIKDSDLDFEKHLREFRAIVDCYALTRQQGVRPYDLLVVFKRTLAPGSTRLKLENEIARAVKAGRLPFQAQAVYDEIIAKSRSTIRESRLQKQTRVENEFDALEMGRMPHSAFLVEWERLLIELDDAGISLPDTSTLYRRYLQKLAPELRSTILTRTWMLDDGPPRKPGAWQECAECVAQELESRADAKAPREHVNAIAVGSLLTCQYCQRHDHHSELCPKRAADIRGESAKCVADFERGGRTCAICHQSDHSEEHHRLAAMDLVAQSSAAVAGGPEGMKTLR